MAQNLQGTKSNKKYHLGSSFPLGSSITNRGVNFSVAAPNAKEIELILFANEDSEEPEEIIKLNSANRSGDYWHIEVEGIGEGTCYGYRASNEAHVNNKDSSLKKILIDPAARAIGGWAKYRREACLEKTDNIRECLKGIVCERQLFDFASHPRPKHSWNKTIIYELHVGSFTRQDKLSSKENIPGTFEYLKEKIHYLKSLGITTIELLPVFSFDPNDAPHGLRNNWGYSPINWFTPHQDYVTGEDPLEARKQFRGLISACHDNNIEVIIDVVYNHTTEGDNNGPIISWKGFGDSTYYHIDSKGHYLDVTGCGNTIAANNPITRKLILESMRCWANELGVDGFRFDLGIALTRGKDLIPLTNPPLFEEIEADPYLSELKLISEPWDCGGLYKLGDFPAKRVCTWNGHFRDDVRKFWKGDTGTIWKLKDRLKGNIELYKNNKNPLNYSINFITSHDGFTLIDLVSFNSKHNFSNGEKNRDGENNNNSWNHGVEGPTSNKEIKELRKRQCRNLLTILLLSPGIPMISMGDEICRSQGGNNNSWCQNSKIAWMPWEAKACDLTMHEFVRRLILLRQQLNELFNPQKPFPENIQETADKNSLWIEWHGIKPKKPDWSNWSHTLSFSINRGLDGAILWMGLNAYSKNMTFELPKQQSSWELLLNTTESNTNLSIHPQQIDSQTSISIQNRGLKILISDEYSKNLSF